MVTDMMMPVMDGAELATAMRDARRIGHIPILMMTPCHPPFLGIAAFTTP